MASNSVDTKEQAYGSGAHMKITPANSPVLRIPVRSSNKTTYQSKLSLQTVIGTTIATPNGFSTHEPTHSFALCAGSTAVLAEFDDEDNINQRFFRARPSAASVHTVPSFHNQNATPATPDSRSRGLSIMRSGGNGNGDSGNCSPTAEWIESVNSRPWSSKERVKAVTCVTISPNGRLLAFGETGHNPRVLIFSTAKDSSTDVPLSILSEHTFGVRSLAFSFNSQYLATLGDMNDGFLLVWNINLRNGFARLHYINKCTSFVRDMCWIGQTLITVGVRHVKVWRLPDARSGSPSSKSRLNTDSPNSASSPPRALIGRNCLLGSLSDHIFTCVASISDSEAVVGTDKGVVCFVQDSRGCPKLSWAKQIEFGVTSMAVDSAQGLLWLGGRAHRIRRFTIESLRASVAATPPSPSPAAKTQVCQRLKGPSVTAMGFLSGHLVTVDSTRAVNVYAAGHITEEEQPTKYAKMSLSAHRDAVLGIGSLDLPNSLDAEFFTWSCGGAVNFWDTGGRCRDSQKVDLEQLQSHDEGVLPNELKIVRAARNMDFFVSGDRLGVLRALSGRPWRCTQEVRAHAGEITDIAMCESHDSSIIASAGRDRMVQLFKKDQDTLELIQTMEDHVGVVGQLLFINEGEKLLSCSADRTILIRDRVVREVDGANVIAYVISKIITLKSSPVSMTLMPDDPDALVFSTVDRCVHQYSLDSGRHIHTFKASDPETSDAVVMGSLSVASGIPGQSPKVLVGVSSTDKSIRVYDFERESLLTGEFGHAEGVSALCLLNKQNANSDDATNRLLVSAGIDGAVMIWNLSVQQQQQAQDSPPSSSHEDEGTPMKELTAAKPPLRRVLSKSEIASIQRADNATNSPKPVYDSPLLLRRKISKHSLAPSSRNGPLQSTTTPPASRRSSVSTQVENGGRSPSPLSPRARAKRKVGAASTASRLSSDYRCRSRISNSGRSDRGGINASSEHICQVLRTYRKKLNTSTEKVHSTKELENELDITLQALNARNKKSGEASESTETDSSGKENQKRLPPPVPQENVRRPHIPRRMPSTPNFSRPKPRHVISRPREGSF